MMGRYVFKKISLRLFATALDFVGYFLVRTKQKFHPNPREILVVRLDQLGDILQTKEFFLSLKGNCPNSRITFLTTSMGKEVSDYFHFCDEVIVWECPWFDSNRKSPSSLWKIIRLLRGNKYDWAFDLRGDIRLILMLKLCGIKTLIGNGSTGGGFLLDVESVWDPAQHAIDKNIEQLKALGLKEKIYSTPGSILMKTTIRKLAVHPDAGAPSKIWRKDNFVQTVKWLLKKNIHIVLVGTNKELGKELESEFPGRLENTMGKTNFHQLIKKLEECDGLLTNDSGPAHVMAGLGKPVWIIWSGVAKATVWAPRGPHVNIISYQVPCSPCSLRICPFPDHPCLNSISVETVVSALLPA